ncbi:MAG: TetR/AcrR family transcriptional regulator [Alteromonadaceae bacterium]|nr:TetR/AcrR family transcriptional regulator [Alteromonadaceae bacterium]
MPPRRKKLLPAAETRFHNNDINATGIDPMTTDAGFAKQSLYNTFSSKAALVAAYIDQRNQAWLGLSHAREAQAATATERILAVFDAYIDHAAYNYANGFRGCGLLNAAAEFPAGSPAREAVKEHKQEVEGILASHLAKTNGADGIAGVETDEQAQATAEHLSFLLEGAVARAGLEGTPERLHNPRAIAARMLNAA